MRPNKHNVDKFEQRMLIHYLFLGENDTKHEEEASRASN